MVDIFGNTVVPGDKIVYSAPISTNSGYNRSTGRSPLVTGIVDKLMAKDSIAVVNVVDDNGRVVKTLQLKSHTIMKYDWDKEVRCK